MLLGLALAVFAGWFALAFLIALGIGRAVRIAEEREEISPALPVSNFIDEAEPLPTMDRPLRRLTLVDA